MNNSTSLNPEFFPERFELNDDLQHFQISGTFLSLSQYSMW